MRVIRKIIKTAAVSYVSALLLAVLIAALPASAANEATATVPVTLTVKNDMRSVNVTVPASLPVYVRNGQVLTASGARITNNSKNGSVRVTAVEVRNGALRVGSYSGFGGSGAIALEINGCGTNGPGYLPITDSAFPGIGPGQSMGLSYSAKVSGGTGDLEGVEACTVIFTISAGQG